MNDGKSLILKRFIETRERRKTRLINLALANVFMSTIAADYTNLYYSYTYLCKKYKYTNYEEAEDLYSDTVLKCYNTIKERGFTGTFYQTYFTTSLRQNLQNHISKEKTLKRKRNLVLRAEEFEGDEHYLMHVNTPRQEEFTTIEFKEDDEEYYSQLIKALKLKNAFGELPIKFQEILNLQYYDSMKYREICRVLGIPMTTVKTRLNTARKLIKTTINKI